MVMKCRCGRGIGGVGRGGHESEDPVERRAAQEGKTIDVSKVNLSR